MEVVYIDDEEENTLVAALLPQSEGSWAWIANPGAADENDYSNFLPERGLTGAHSCNRIFSLIWEIYEDQWDDQECHSQGPVVCETPAVDCVMTEWVDSGICSKPCGTGKITQTRSVQTEAAHGGTTCPTDVSRDGDQDCNTHECLFQQGKTCGASATDGTQPPQCSTAAVTMGAGSDRVAAEKCLEECQKARVDIVTKETWATAQTGCCHASCTGGGICSCIICNNGMSFHPEYGQNTGNDLYTTYSTPELTDSENPNHYAVMKPGRAGRSGTECTCDGEFSELPNDWLGTTSAWHQKLMFDVYDWLQNDKVWTWKNQSKKKLIRALGHLAYNKQGGRNALSEQAEEWFEAAFLTEDTGGAFTTEKWNALKSSVADYMGCYCEIYAFPTIKSSDAEDWMTSKFGCLTPDMSLSCP